MALYCELPAYKLAYDMLLAIYGWTKLFTREHKYTLGEKLKNETLELLINIYKANRQHACSISILQDKILKLSVYCFVLQKT